MPEFSVDSKLIKPHDGSMVRISLVRAMLNKTFRIPLMPTALTPSLYADLPHEPPGDGGAASQVLLRSRGETEERSRGLLSLVLARRVE